ncbi:MAG: hypothetical protein AB2604_10580 [Candidatus Thiodiazotropha taylori]
MDDIRNAIVSNLETIAGIGNVHAFERYAKSQSVMKTLYKYGNRLLGWNVRRVTTSERSEALGRWIRVYRWEIKGYLSLDDSEKSEIVFDNLIEEICSVFRADDTLGGVVDTCIVNNEAGIQVSESYPVLFAGVLCHSARLALNTRIYL